MWKFQWLQEMPYAEIIQGCFKRFSSRGIFLYPFLSRNALIKGCLVWVTVLIIKEKTMTNIFYSDILRYILKFPKHEKVTLIIPDERGSWLSFLTFGEGHLRWASGSSVSVRNNRWLNTATHDWQLFPDIWVKSWGKRPKRDKGAGLHVLLNYPYEIYIAP